MRVLMFGWEFPPYVTGGLGTACYGLAKELSKVTDRILFVIPRGDQKVPPAGLGRDNSTVMTTPPRATPAGRSAADEDSEAFYQMTPSPMGFELAGATERQGTLPDEDAGPGALPSLLTAFIDSPLRPYLSASAYERIINLAQSDGGARLGPMDDAQRMPGRRGATHSASNSGDDSEASAAHGADTGDLYGSNLFAEVVRYSRLAARFASMEPFDVIHAHDWMTFPAGVVAKRTTGRPLVVHVHALEFDRSGDQVDQRVYDIERQGMEAADLVIAVSARTRQTIIERYGIPSARVRVLHNGVLELPEHIPVRMAPIFEEKVVVFLGRITMQKGPEYFIEAAWRVVRAFPRVRFVMAGVGDMLQRMIMLSAQLRLNQHFHFTGFVSEEQRAALLARADLFVMTSVSEPFGLTPVEAAQHNVPLIIPHQSGVSEILRHAIKVDFWDTDRIADAMIHVLSNPKLAQHMAKETRAELHNSTWSHAASKLKEFYQEVV